MKRPTINTVRTSFGTVLAEINPKEVMFEVEQDVTAKIDTPLEDVKGTTKTFLKDSVVRGTLWIEVDKRKGKQRRVVMVQGENGRYLVPAKDVRPITKAEVDAKAEIEKLGSKVDELLQEAKDEAKEFSQSDFLTKKYAGFTGKQIIVGAAAVIVLMKIFK